jgi:hypothetical protein
MTNYQCRKCRAVIEAYFMPSPTVTKCPNGIHEWIDMGTSEGFLLGYFQRYICSKCKETLKSDGKPEKEGCPKGEHDWHDINDYYPPGDFGGNRA